MKEILEIKRHFHRREMGRRAGVLILLLFGFPALCFGPVVMSCVYWLLAIIWGFDVSWTWFLTGSFVVIVPLLFWTEFRTRGTFYTTSVLSTYGNDTSLPPLLTGLSDVDQFISFVKHPRDPYVGLVELFLWGPRQILEAITVIRDSSRVSRADRNCAAGILNQLRSSGHAELNPITSDITGNCGLAVAYLAYYDWIGISSDRSKIWIDKTRT